MLTFNLTDLEVQSKIGSVKRLIDLPNGGRLEAADISALEAAMPSKTIMFWRNLHYLENHLGWVFVSLVATVFAGWFFFAIWRTKTGRSTWQKPRRPPWKPSWASKP